MSYTTPANAKNALPIPSATPHRMEVNEDGNEVIVLDDSDDEHAQAATSSGSTLKRARSITDASSTSLSCKKACSSLDHVDRGTSKEESRYKRLSSAHEALEKKYKAEQERAKALKMKLVKTEVRHHANHSSQPLISMK